MSIGEQLHLPFLPAGLGLGQLPPAVQRAVLELVAPAHEELVVQAPSVLERAAGSSFVFLLLMELLEQFELAGQVGDATADGGTGLTRELDLERYLKLMSAKDKAVAFLMRVRTYRARYGVGLPPILPLEE